MANVLRFVMDQDDERAFLNAVSGLRLEVYPVRVPEGWRPFRAEGAALERLPEESLYLAASDAGPVLVDRIKRGPDKGSWRVDEVRSPVIYFERSRTDEEGARLSGKLWAELEITPQTGRRDAAPERFRQTYLEVEAWFKRACRRSEPAGFWIGPHAARRSKDGMTLKDAEPPGKTLRPFR
jgi:hypothetical protein